MISNYDAAYTRFLERLKEARTRASISQVELSARLQKHQTYVSKIETGQRLLDLVGYLTWARELEADPMELLAGLADEVQRRKPVKKSKPKPR